VDLKQTRKIAGLTRSFIKSLKDKSETVDLALLEACMRQSRDGFPLVLREAVPSKSESG